MKIKPQKDNSVLARLRKQGKPFSNESKLGYQKLSFENRLKEIFNYFKSVNSSLMVSVIGHADDPIYVLENSNHYLQFFEQNKNVIPFAEDRKTFSEETEKMLLTLKKGKVYFMDFYQGNRFFYRLEFALVKSII